MGTLHIELDQGIAVITIDNPPVNVMSIDIGRQIDEVVRRFSEDNSVLALIFTGQGEKAFMAGADIKEFPRYLKDAIAEDSATLFDATLQRLYRIGKPTIAALNGLTLGGGCELALACDFRIAEEQALIGFPEIKLGLFPGAGGTQRLPRLIGESRAKELIFTGEPISATEAYRIGLVNRVVPTGQSVEEARQFADIFRQRSLVSLRLAKESIQNGLDLTLDDGLKLEARNFGRVFETEDVREGVAAFIEKRTAKFKHC